MAATIVLALVTTTLADLRTGAVSSGLASARDLARDAVAQYRAELVADPWYFLTQVDEHERARTCTAAPATSAYRNTAIQPGQDWPAECGATWTYATPATSADVRLEVTPPGPRDGVLVVSAVARSSDVYGGWRTRLQQRPTGEWTLATEDGLDMDWVQTSGAAMTGASLYSGGNLDRGQVAYTDSTLVAEGTISGSGTLSDTLTYSGVGRPDGLDTGGDTARYAQLVPATQASLTDELDLRVRVRIDQVANVGIAQRWGATAAQQAWSLYTNASGNLVLATSAGVTATSTSALTASSTVWVRARFSSKGSSGVATAQLFTAPGTVSMPTAWRTASTLASAGSAQKLQAATSTSLQAGIATASGTARSSGTSRVLALQLRSAADAAPVAAVDFTDPGLGVDATTIENRAGGSWQLVGAQLAASVADAVGTARDVTIAPLRISGVAAGAEAVRSLVCPDAAPTNVVAGGVNRTSQLCLKRGGTVISTSDQSVTVPSDTVAYRLDVSARDTGNASAAARVSQVAVYTSSKASAAPTTGDLIAGSSTPAAAGTHPGTSGYWTKLADVWLPASGVVTTDVDVHLGLCGDGFYQVGGSCSTMAPGESVTVLAGSVAAPGDVWLSGPVSDSNATLAAFATGYLVVPYWARARGSGDTTTQVVAVAQGLGLSPSGASQTAPVQAYPAPTDRAANAPTGTLTMRSVAARALDLRSFGRWGTVTFAPGDGATVRPAPYAPAFEQRWESLSTRAVPGEEICPTPTCSGWFG